MKRILIAMAILILGFTVLTVIAAAQEAVKQVSSAINLGALGKPTFSETKNGIKAQIWLLTREEHDRILSLPKERQPTKGEQGYQDKFSASNPEIAIVVLDDLGEKVPIQNAILEITAKSPSGKPLTRGLIAARDYYATNLEFSEKGVYKLALRITRNGMTTMMYFETPVSISMN